MLGLESPFGSDIGFAGHNGKLLLGSGPVPACQASCLPLVLGAWPIVGALLIESAVSESEGRRFPWKGIGPELDADCGCCCGLSAPFCVLSSAAAVLPGGTAWEPL